MTKLQKLASALLIGLAMSGCAGSATPGPETNKLLAELPRVTTSPRDTCQTQREAAAQNSYVDTIRDGTEKVYKPSCDLDPKAKPKRVSAPGGRLPAGQSPGASKDAVLSEIEKEFHEAMDAELRQSKQPAPTPAVDADVAKRTG